MLRKYKYILAILVFLLSALSLFTWLWQSGHDSWVEIDGQKFRVAIADEPGEWQRGLSGQSQPQMMLFIFPESEQRSFWMQGMLYSIDIVWLQDGQVVGLERDLPWPAEPTADLPHFRSPQPVNMVLEIPVDFRRQSGINIERGELLKIKI